MATLPAWAATAAGWPPAIAAATTTRWPGQRWDYPAVTRRPLRFPADFGAHPDFRTEWWYLTAWLDGRGFQITFFRSRTIHPAGNPSRFAPTQLLFAHAALMLPSRRHPLHAERAARLGEPGTRAATGDTDLAIGDWSLRRDPQDRYRIELRDRAFSASLIVEPGGSAPWLQGDAGFSRKGPAPEQASHYYSRPQLPVRGRITVPPSPSGGRDAALPADVAGRAWFDHEWSSTLLDPRAGGWDWIGLNLDDGSALAGFRIRQRGDGQVLFDYAARRDADGRSRILPAIRFTPLAHWRSPRTRIDWPVRMRIEVDGQTWRLEPLFEDQELDSRASTGNIYWEGAVIVLDGERRIGAGYLELTGYREPVRL